MSRAQRVGAHRRGEAVGYHDRLALVIVPGHDAPDLSWFCHVLSFADEWLRMKCCLDYLQHRAHEAAVDPDGGAGDVARFPRREERHQVREFSLIAHSADGGPLPPLSAI